MKPLLLALVLSLLPSCGGSSDPRTLNDEGSKALNSGDYSGAADSFDEALAALGSDTSKPEWLQAKLGGIQARAHTDAPRAKQDFLDLAAASPSKVTADHFNMVASRLGDANHLEEATAVLQAGMAVHKESPHLQALLTELGNKAKESGDTSALDALEGLGYVGD